MGGLTRIFVLVVGRRRQRGTERLVEAHLQLSAAGVPLSAIAGATSFARRAPLIIITLAGHRCDRPEETVLLVVRTAVK